VKIDFMSDESFPDGPLVGGGPLIFTLEGMVDFLAATYPERFPNKEAFLDRLRINYTDQDAYLIWFWLKPSQAAHALSDICVWGRAQQIINYYEMMMKQSNADKPSLFAEASDKLRSHFELEASRSV
jgi:hypothetical protein